MSLPQPVQNISVDDDPARGEANAPVTIVEFTDFQCPACAAMHPVLEEVLKSYGNKVRFVVRDFPLNQHECARKAAEAANAANAQGKFFEYIALLFKNQKALDVPSLKKYASELGLDRARFDAALDRGVYAAEVQERRHRRRDVRSRKHANDICKRSTTQNSECGRFASSDRSRCSEPVHLSNP